MRFAPGPITFHPTSPSGPPYTGHVDPSGDMLIIDPDVFLYDAAIGAYSRQEPGNPPGDWHYVWNLAESGPLEETYLRGWASLPATDMKHVATEVGQYA